MRSLRAEDASSDLSRRTVLLGFGLLVLLPQIAAMVWLPVIPVMADTAHFFDMTRAFAPSGPVDPLVLRPGALLEEHFAYLPGYPIFLDLCKLFVPVRHLGRLVVAVQHLMSFATAVLIWRAGRHAGWPRAGLAAALTYGVYYPRVFHAQSLHYETPLALLFTLSVHLFLRFMREGRLAVLAACGAALGAAFWIKPVVLAAVPVFLWTLLARRADRRAVSLFVAFAAATVGSVFFYNTVFRQYPHFTTFVGWHLGNRVFGRDRLVDPTDPNTRFIVETLRGTPAADRFPGHTAGYIPVFQDRSGLSGVQADRVVLGAALAAVRAHPGAYAWGTVKAFRGFFGGSGDRLGMQAYDPGRFQELLRRVREREKTFALGSVPRRLSWYAIDLRGFRLSWDRSVWLRRWHGLFRSRVFFAVRLAALAAAGLVALRRRQRVLRLLIALAAAVLLASALTEASQARYAEMLMPLFCLIVWAPLGGVLDRDGRAAA